LHDRVDEWLMSFLTDFEGKGLQAVTKGSVDFSGLGLEEKEKPAEPAAKQHEEEFKSLLDKIKTFLGEKVKDVRLTDRLINSPCCLVADEQDMSIHLQNMLKAAGQNFPASKPIFELNPEHRLVLKMQSEMDKSQFNDWVMLLFEQAQLAQ